MTRENEIKESLLIWLKKPYEEPPYSFKENLESYNGIDETLVGARHFIRDGNSYKTLHSVTNDLSLGRSKNSYKWLAASVIIVVVGLGSILTLFLKQDPYEEYLVIEEGLPVFMGEQTNTKDQFMNAYRTGNYEEALKLGESLQKNDTVYFYMGCAHLYNKEYEESIKYFKNVKPDSRFYCNSVYQNLFASIHLKENSQIELLKKELSKMECSQYINKASLLIKKASE